MGALVGAAVGLLVGLFVGDLVGSGLTVGEGVTGAGVAIGAVVGGRVGAIVGESVGGLAHFPTSATINDTMTIAVIQPPIQTATASFPKRSKRFCRLLLLFCFLN